MKQVGTGNTAHQGFLFLTGRFEAKERYESLNACQRLTTSPEFLSVRDSRGGVSVRE